MAGIWKGRQGLGTRSLLCPCRNELVQPSEIVLLYYPVRVSVTCMTFIEHTRIEHTHMRTHDTQMIQSSERGYQYECLCVF